VATVAKIWRTWYLQPWRVETFKFSTDPELEAKVRDVRTSTLSDDCHRLEPDMEPQLEKEGSSAVEE
jgi:hypothetical protein